MKLNKGSLFALIAVLELAGDSDRQLSTTDIADKYGISTHHLAKVMRNLVHVGLVQAVRGVGGGYRFAGNVNRTTLLDVIQLFETLESELDLHRWNEAGTPIVMELQSITNEIDDLTKAILDTITLETALKNVRKRSEALPGQLASTSEAGGELSTFHERTITVPSWRAINGKCKENFDYQSRLHIDENRRLFSRGDESKCLGKTCR